jgi:hypothetical protein
MYARVSLNPVLHVTSVQQLAVATHVNRVRISESVVVVGILVSPCVITLIVELVEMLAPAIQLVSLASPTAVTPAAVFVGLVLGVRQATLLEARAEVVVLQHVAEALHVVKQIRHVIITLVSVIMVPPAVANVVILLVLHVLLIPKTPPLDFVVIILAITILSVVHQIRHVLITLVHVLPPVRELLLLVVLLIRPVLVVMVFPFVALIVPLIYAMAVTPLSLVVLILKAVVPGAVLTTALNVVITAPRLHHFAPMVVAVIQMVVVLAVPAVLMILIAQAIPAANPAVNLAAAIQVNKGDGHFFSYPCV